MRTLLIAALFVSGHVMAQDVTLDGATASVSSATGISAANSYPAVRKGNVVDIFHGVKVADPYRWMEDLQSSELDTWIKSQNRLSAQRLEGDARYTSIRAQLEQLKDVYLQKEVGREVGGNTFHRALVGDRIHLFVQTPGTEPRALVDARTLGKDSSVKSYEPSPDGRLVAYVMGLHGADWNEIRIRDVDTDRDLDVVLPNVRQTPLAWTADGSGLVYLRYAPPRDGKREAPAEDPGIYLHRLGSPVASDQALYLLPPDRQDWDLDFGLSGGRQQLFIYQERGPWHDGNLGGARAQTWMLELDTSGRLRTGSSPRQVTESDAAYRVLHVDGRRALVFTDKDAPRRRVVEIDLVNPQLATWRDFVPQGPGVLNDAEWFGGRLVVHAMENVHSVVRVYNRDGALQGEVPLPGTGVVQRILGSAESPRIWLVYSGLLQSPVVLDHDLDTGKTEVTAAGAAGPDMTDFEVRQEWFVSKDGTKVPMFIAHRRGLQRDGRHPLILDAYGASSTPNLPAFRQDLVTWLQMGGVFAIANIRGGGEFGNDWYTAAIRERKQTSFDDLIAASEYLIAEGWTTPRRLGISGGSNGGMLVTATMLQRPDLFGAVLADVPWTDALRLHLSGNGPRQREQWGSPEEPAMFKALYAYSPLHNVQAGRCYPATLVSTQHDDERLPAWHAYKFIAALQAGQGCTNPILLQASASGGHGGGGEMSTAKQLTFAATHLGLPAQK